MKYVVLLSIAFSIISCTTKQENQEGGMFENGKWIELSYPFSNETLYWPNNLKGFTMDTLFEGMTPGWILLFFIWLLCTRTWRHSS